MQSATLALHAGFDCDPTTGAVAVPIYQTVAFGFESAEHAAALFNLETEGHRYSRISNPTNAVLEHRVAALEGGVEALSVSTGQAAIFYAISNLVEPGCNIVSVPQLYGTTHSMFAHFLPRQGVTVQFPDSDQPADVERAINAGTRAVYCETVGNPAGNVTDIAALAEVAHKHGIPLVVDNTVASPILCQPIKFGADVVIHSLTKFMGGHGTSLGGIIVDSGRFPWADHPQRFPMFNQPDESYHGLVYAEHFGPAAFVARCRSVYLRTTGAALSPFNAFLIIQGIETLAVRVDRHVENAKRVAEFLRGDRRVEWINYAGFGDSVYNPNVRKYLGGRACSLLTFGTKGGYEGGVRFYNALKLVKRVVNLGDSKTLACHPASTTHRQMSPAEQLKAGVAPEAIRISVGIEHIDDIVDDLEQALAAAVDLGQCGT
jgi:O-acetylhomoserine (thiol)-lyase